MHNSTQDAHSASAALVRNQILLAVSIVAPVRFFAQRQVHVDVVLPSARKQGKLRV
jgi:hypothetical protein